MNAVEINHLSHAYAERIALSDLSLSVPAGEVFGLLGPNGSGKTTLFRILSTLILSPPGTVKIFGRDPGAAQYGSAERDAVRRLIGVVFQSPSLDKQLSARENLTHHGHLYGLSGNALRERVEAVLTSFNLAGRANERINGFSGGMRRRVEVAKGLLHSPRLLLMDEPSTGLDPAARIDLWQIIGDITKRSGVTVLLTTHLMEEADRCDRLAILQAGRLLACDRPTNLKNTIGGDVITMSTLNVPALQAAMRDKLLLASTALEDVVRLVIEVAQNSSMSGQVLSADSRIL